MYPPRKFGTIWRSYGVVLGNGTRTEIARIRAEAADAFIAAGREISDRIFREGPWPTALRLTTPFTNRSNA